jgi:hypothetical protein
MRKLVSSFLFLSGFFCLLLLFGSFFNEKPEEPENPKSEEPIDHRLPQVIKSPDMNKVYEFAGEILPSNFDIKERLDRELLVNAYWHSSTVLYLKNASKYFPIIEPILAEHGIPEDFKYLCVIESNLRNETSSAGAKGIWQFMKPTGTGYGLEVNNEVDERYHLEKATHAACKYILDDKKRFGTWINAAAAYNVGGTRLARNMRAQKTDSYFDLNLNSETMRYVFRIVAVKEILSQPENFGFYVEELKKYNPLLDYKTVEVTGSIESLGDFAKKHNTTYRMLKVFNPWLIDSHLTNKYGKTYEIKIPLGEF